VDDLGSIEEPSALSRRRETIYDVVIFEDLT
jgi:hypothetical protein